MQAMTRGLGLAAVAAALAVAAAACGGGGGESAETSAGTSGTTSTTAPAATSGDAANGEAVWASAGCGSCHTLAAAGSSGAVGPNLDELKPGVEAVVSQVTDGGGGMPAFSDSLSEQEIQDVAAYVVQSTSG